MTPPRPRTPLSLILVAFLVALRLNCVCDEGLAHRGPTPSSVEHACCTEGAHDHAGRPHGPSNHDHDGRGCPHCGDGKLAFVGVAATPDVKSVVSDVPLVLSNASRTAVAISSNFLAVRSTPGERTSRPPDFPVLMRTCILLI